MYVGLDSSLADALQMHTSMRKLFLQDRNCVHLQVCAVCVPSASAAASLLGDALSPAEWAVFRHVIGAALIGMPHGLEHVRCILSFLLLACIGPAKFLWEPACMADLGNCMISNPG